MIRTKLAAVILIVGVLQPLTAAAFETDQFNLPPVPLADIGDEVSAYVRDNIAAAVKEINEQIDHSEECLARRPVARKCGSVKDESERLDRLRSSDGLADAVFKRLGEGDLFHTRIDKWIGKHKFSKQPWSYKTGYKESIYVAHPLDYWTISPTVNLYGTEFGVDKIAHFFQQGHQYFETYNKALGEGMSDSEARSKAISWGKKTERTYFGLLVSGVYSNADLYANYAGMDFYISLTRDQRVAGRSIPALTSLRAGHWSIRPGLDNKEILRPFIGDQLNEAFNPSSFAFNLFGSVKRAVKRNACAEWRMRYASVAARSIRDRIAATETWMGADYGFTKRNRTVNIAELCFDDDPAA